MPGSTGTAAIRIINKTPNLIGRTGGGSPAMYIDEVELREARDCGVGATCHENTRFNVGYTCMCDKQGYVGHDQTNAEATCEDASSMSPLELLNETVAVLKEHVQASTNSGTLFGWAFTSISLGSLHVRPKRHRQATWSRQCGVDKGAKRNRVGRRSRVITIIITAPLQALTGENKRLGDALAGVKDSVASMGAVKVDVNALQASQAALKSKLLSALADAAVPTMASSTGASRTTPAIVANDDGVDVQIGDGQRLKVNGEEMLTSADVVTTINDVLAQLAADL